MTTTYVNWGEEKVKLTWCSDKQLPPRRAITSVHGFCFLEGKLLLVNLNHRGWDFPGGHIENGETPEECFKREAMEEGYVTGSCELLGHIIVNQKDNPKWNETSPYPKIGYQVFYSMNIERVHDFKGQYESEERIFIHPFEITNYYHDWHEVYEEIVNEAL
ncbi:NUDIX domain-containing protein [Bacillus sp. NTK071]|uniref:NUDIX hydrolase n=1 Tax=Bacillus sp. NTK071 TaxID=2802175 RepID=UPI001A907D27|nr:NUDIX domain-containing protein [Bacillus sp. NTK071]MBN8209009.1 NUDIX domain-containing protein [Bacillus sp. NTK071]